MTTALTERPTNGAGILAQIDQDTLSKLVLNGDLSQLKPDEKTAYYIYRCNAAGLDPATKPFDLLKLSGKEVLYATKECSSQISQRDGLSVTVASDAVMGDIYRVVARAQSPSGRATDDMGCVNIKGLSGDALCNAMMKATTKAKRRAILTHAGLGMLDESELDTVQVTPPAPKKETTVPTHPITATVDAPPVVQEEPTVLIDHDQTPEDAAPTDDGMVKVGIIDIKESSGTSKDGKPWKKWGLKCSIPSLGEVWVNTFSETHMKKALELQGSEGLLSYSIRKYSDKNGQQRDSYNVEKLESLRK